MKTVILAFLILGIVLSQNQQRKQDGILTSFLQLKEKLSQSSKFLALVVIAGKSCEHCEKAHFIFESYKMNMEGYVNSYFMDCDQMWDQVFEREHFAACDPKNSNIWPIIQFFKPPAEDYDPSDGNDQSKRQPEVIQYKDPVSENRLIDYSKTIMPLFANEVRTEQDIQKQLENKTLQNKVMLFIRENEEIPYYFKALSSHFRYKIHFCVVIADQELLDQYKIEDTPQILAFRFIRQKQSYKQEVYVGPKRIQSAITFFKKYSSGFEKKDLNLTYKPKTDSRKYNITMVNQFKDIPVYFSIDQGVLLYLITDQTSTDDISFESLQQIHKFQSFIEHFKTYVDSILIYKYQQNQSVVEQEEFFTLNKLGVQEDHLLFYPTGIKNINQFFKVRAKLQKKQMISEIFSLMENKEDILDEEAMQHYIKHAMSTNRIATSLFIDTKDKQSQELLFVFRYLSNQKKFRDCSSFGIYKDVTKEQQKHWQIDSLPFIVSFLHNIGENNQLQTAVYDSAPDFSYLALHNYLSQLCFSKEKEKIESVLIAETNNQQNFDKYCGNGEECLIAFLDYSRENKFKIELDLFKTLSEKLRNHKAVNWVYIDGRCHKQLLKRINLSDYDMPYLLYYNSKNWKYKVMEESFVFQNMLEFTQKLLGKKNKKAGLLKLEDAIDIDEKDCELQRQKKYDL
ncbi:hypothetical protein ABPG74_016344 [Tetrahymena malaccensis]